MNKTTFVFELSEEIQEEIKNDLRNVHISDSDLIRALGSRLCDLEETIDIEKYL